MGLGDYVQNIRQAANSILEGMAVTFSHMFREPITVEYPDRTDRPITEMLPVRYRGFLEVQMDICTGCKRCEKACPIEVIAIDLVKSPETKKNMLGRFDIDMGKCMYCGLCVEACIAESTGAIRHTREFEGSTSTLDALVFKFVEPGELTPMYKAPKDKSQIPMGEYGPYAREARERAMRDNPAVLEELRRQNAEQSRGKKSTKKSAGKKGAAAAAGPDPGKVAAIKAKIETVNKADVTKFAAVLEELTAQTDCGACGYPTCHDYTVSMANGSDHDPSKCEPGGVESAMDLDTALKLATAQPVGGPILANPPNWVQTGPKS